MSKELEHETQWHTMETAPKDGTEVLVFSNIGLMVSFYFKGMWREKANMLGLRKDPTHWMPLPKAPKEGV